MGRLLKGRGGWWVFEGTYEERAVPKGAGFWWNTNAYPRTWATKSLESATKLKGYAEGETLRELEGTVAKKSENIEASKAVDAAIEVPRPDGLEYMGFQKAGIAYALSRSSTLIGDEMGLGKTIQALGVVNATKPGRVLVICPASLRLNWLSEAKKWLVEGREYWVVDSAKAVPSSANFVICNFDRLGVEGIDCAWDLLIVDEAHRLKNPKAKRTKAVIGVAASRDRERVAGLVDKCARKIFLSGTPVLNRPIELFPLLSALDSEGLGKSFWGFAKRYCDAHEGKYGWDFSGASALDELQRRLRETIMVRRLKKDVLKDLPPKRRQLVVVPCNGASSAVESEKAAWAGREESIAMIQARVDGAWANEDKEAYESAVSELTTAARHAFEEISSARHTVALAKADAFVEYCKDVLESTDKIVVFGHHHDVIAKIVEGLAEFEPVRITGEDALEVRDAAVERFQQDPKCRVIVGSIFAMGVGLTLTASSTVLFAELDWVPANVTQAEDRCHRIGQTDSVTVVHVVLDGSLDQRMAELLVAKQAIADRALDVDCAIAPVVFAGQVEEKADPCDERPVKASEYDDTTKARVLEALRFLARRCDGARRLDGEGFSKFDVEIGLSLAGRTSLSDRQTWLGLKLCRKYRRQLSEGGIEILQ